MRLLDLIQCFLTSDTKINLLVRVYALVKKKALHDCEAELLVINDENLAERQLWIDTVELGQLMKLSRRKDGI